MASVIAEVEPNATETVAAVARACAPHGFDLVSGFRVQSYNPTIPVRYRLPTFGRSSTLAIVIGGSRAIWEPFLRWLAADEGRRGTRHPLDRYTQEIVTEAARAVGGRHQIRWSHSRLSRQVAIQKAAYTAGLGFHAPCHLAIHPRFGLWIGLRAVIAVDRDLPSDPTVSVPHPCEGCARPCVAAFEAAHAAVAGGEACDGSPWLAVREACPRHEDSARYDSLQLRYHYTKDRHLLREAIRRLR